MDIMMLKMSGVETLKRLKKIERFNEYLSKPIEKQEIKRVLDKCLNKK